MKLPELQCKLKILELERLGNREQGIGKEIERERETQKWRNKNRIEGEGCHVKRNRLDE